MIITSVTLKHFRNFEDKDFAVHPGIWVDHPAGGFCLGFSVEIDRRPGGGDCAGVELGDFFVYFNFRFLT